MPDNTQGERVPKGYCIWKIDLEKNIKSGILTYEQLYQLDTKENMKNAEHKVNHIMINPSGNRFMFLHRWIKNGVKSTRLLTADLDGKNVYILLDDDMVSHCTWKDDNTILCWAKKNGIGMKYLLLKDQTHEFRVIENEKLIVDGHPSYKNGTEVFVTDTYPDFKRKQHLYLYDDEKQELKQIASVFSNFRYRNDCRCDLHPRWNRSGTEICFDGAQKNKRQVYVVKVGDTSG